MKKLLWLPLLLALVGCSDPYGASLKAHNTIATGINNAMTTVDTFRQQGAMTADEEVTVIGYLEYANKGNEAFEACTVTAHTNGNVPGSYTACAQTFLDTLDSPAALGLIKVSAPATNSSVQVIIQGVITGANLIITSLGGA